MQLDLGYNEIIMLLVAVQLPGKYYQHGAIPPDQMNDLFTATEKLISARNMCPEHNNAVKDSAEATHEQK